MPTNKSSYFVLYSSRNYSSYPAKPFKCHPTCHSCNGTSSNNCTSCGNYSTVRLGGTSCLICTDPLCLKCDSSAGICEFQHQPNSCQENCSLCADTRECRVDGCESGFFYHGGKCIGCVSGCLTCSDETDKKCLTC